MTDVVEDPGWQRILAAARRKIERSAGAIEGSVGIAKPTDAERRVVIGITGRHRAADVASLRVDLSEVDDALRDTCGQGLLAVLAQHDGPVRNRVAERASEDEAKAAALADLRSRSGTHRVSEWFEEFSAQLAADGTVTRLVRRGDADILGWAGEVLNRLPAQDLPLPVLAEWATGNTKALAGTSLASLVLRALAAHDGVPAPVTAEDRRTRWEAAGVIVRSGEPGPGPERPQPGRSCGVRLVERRGVVRHPVPAHAASADHGPADSGRPAPVRLREPGGPARRGHRAGREFSDVGLHGGTAVSSLSPAAGRVPWQDPLARRLRLDRPSHDVVGDGPVLGGPVAHEFGGVPGSAGNGRLGTAEGSRRDKPVEPSPASSMADAGRAIMEERLIPVLLEDLKR